MGLHWIPGERGCEPSFDPGLIRFGGNSGFQAVNIAALMGAKRIVLLGFDMQATGGKRHWFGDHPGVLNKASKYWEWAKAMDAAAPHYAKAGIEIVNCSRQTALTAYPRARIEDVLC